MGRALFTLSVIAPGVCFAQVGGLVGVPTTDTIGQREIEFSVLHDSQSRTTSRAFLFGLTPNAEGAIGLNPDGTNSFGFKFRPWSSRCGHNHFALGWDGIQQGRGTSFALFSRDISGIRAHFGVLSDDTTDLSLGLDGALGDQFSWALDHRSGIAGATCFGLWYSPTNQPDFSLSLSLVRTNANEWGWMPGLARTIRF